MGSTVATLIMYAIFAGALTGGYALWHHSIFKQGADAQLKKDETLYNACIADKNTAIGANKTLQADLNVLKTTVNEQNTEIDKLEIALKKAKEKRARETAKNEPFSNSLLNDKAQELAKAAIALGGTCEQKLGRITIGLKDLAKREVQDRPPTKEEAKGLLQIN
jgi:hypothetical protein